MFVHEENFGGKEGLGLLDVDKEILPLALQSPFQSQKKAERGISLASFNFLSVAGMDIGRIRQLGLSEAEGRSHPAHIPAQLDHFIGKVLHRLFLLWRDFF
ncbi:MAG: hypothetical protein PHV34_09605 [Verrucomicrobiae bacterium]|nr:hypothetical protein [Verrucomicrobiae bacterium]